MICQRCGGAISEFVMGKRCGVAVRFAMTGFPNQQPVVPGILKRRFGAQRGSLQEILGGSDSVADLHLSGFA